MILSIGARAIKKHQLLPQFVNMIFERRTDISKNKPVITPTLSPDAISIN